MERILQVVDSMGMGGIQSFIMNIYRNIDRDNIQFDFLLHHKYANSFDKEILEMGGKIYYLPSRNEGIIKNKKALNNFFKQHKEYKVIHQHESSLTYIEPLIAAKEYDIKTRIIHCHSTKASGNPIHTLLHKINKKRISKIATDYFACGDLAADWMFSGTKVMNDVKIIHNGIDIKKFEFNSKLRNKVRQELKIEDKFVIGNIGRFSNIKNHSFLIEIFKEFLNINSNSLLLLVGDGEERSNIERKVMDLNIGNKVLFLGLRNDIPYLMQAMDVIVMPSLYEGFPVVTVEALANGLPVYLSNTITKEVLLKNNVYYIDLNIDAKQWAKKISENHNHREIDNSIIYKRGFDIRNVAMQLMQYYIRKDAHINENK